MKVVLASHGDFCFGILNSYQMIAGENKQIVAVSLDDSGIEIFTQRFTSLLDQVLETDEVLILTDIKGGTPYNEAFNYFMKNSSKTRVIAGMNLPMVIELGLNLSHNSLEELYQLGLNVGRSSIEGAEETETQIDDIEF